MWGIDLETFGIVIIVILIIFIYRKIEKYLKVKNKGNREPEVEAKETKEGYTITYKKGRDEYREQQRKKQVNEALHNMDEDIREWKERKNIHEKT